MSRRLLLVALLAFVGTSGHVSSLSPFCAGALMAQARGEDPQMPPPGGNPDHSEPAKGAYCDRSAATAHHCECHNACVENEDGSISQQEDGPHCRAYCWKKFCRCPWDGCKTPAPGAKP